MVVVTASQSTHCNDPNSVTFGDDLAKGRLRIRYVMPSTHLSLREEDVVRLALEFLHNRDLHIAQLSLERETGVINGNFADDVLFLRQLILDGQWDDVLEFIQPLGALPAFQIDKFNYAILRHKYIELLCIKSEIKAYNNVDNVVEEVVKVLNEIEKLAPSKEEYSNLCLLLTLPSITDHTSFKKWNPSNARVQCFREVYPLVEHFLPSDKKGGGTPVAKSSKNDRLIQLLIKGILYESCVNYCQTKASGTKESQSQEVSFSRLLDGCGFDESDLSLLSWLQSIPAETFGVPFEQRTLNVDVERLERPSLHTSWTEHMLVTPIKPRAFPHLAMPFRRPRSAADAMTRSLRPLPDGAPRHPALLALSAVDLGPGVHSSCFAGFHLTGIRGGIAMNASVDRLFEKEATGADSPADAIHKKVIEDGNVKPTNAVRPESPENVTVPVNANVSSAASANASAASTPERRGRESPTTVAASTARSSRRDSLSERTPAPPNTLPVIQAPVPPPDADFRRELLKEYQIQKQRECDDYIRQLCSQDNPMKDSVSDGGLASDGGATSACEERTEEHPRPVNGARGPQQQSPSHQPQVRRRDSLGIPASPPTRDLQHPSDFPSILRRDNHGGSNVSLRRDSPSPTARVNPNRYSMGSLANLRHNSPAFNLNRRDSIGNTFSAINGYIHNSHNAHTVNFNRRDSLHIPSNGTQVPNVRDIKRDYVGSSGNVIKKEPPVNRRLSIDSLDSRRNSWDPGRRGSVSLQDCEDNPVDKVVRTMKQPPGRGPSAAGARGIVAAAGARPTFRAVTVLEDLQAVRCAEFHPNGKLYAVGSNTKTLRICAYPKIDDITFGIREGPFSRMFSTIFHCQEQLVVPSVENHEAFPPSVLFKRTKHHKGSIYCLAWSPAGDLLATGSNDKTVKLMRFNTDTSNLEGQEVELAMHDGTVRDVCFIEDTSNKTSLLVSGGAGDCKIYVTDCATGKPFKALNGHSGHVLSLYNWGGAMFVSGSQDKTVRFWDLRTGQCVNIITPITTQGSRGSPVASLAVDPSGRLLVTGHEDGSCGLHDVRGSRPLQRLASPHSADVRSVRFSPGAYYLLTGGYDGRLALTDLQGDLTMPLPSVVVASHPDKVISGRWHPEDFSFLSTSADKTCALWTIPPV